MREALNGKEWKPPISVGTSIVLLSCWVGTVVFVVPSFSNKRCGGIVCQTSKGGGRSSGPPAPVGDRGEDSPSLFGASSVAHRYGGNVSSVDREAISA